MTYWRPPLMWEGSDVWIIGGGASLAHQFNVPADVIKKVESGQEHISIYSDYLKPLHDKHVIGVNLSFMLGNWVSVLYFCDKSFYRVYRNQINSFRNLKVTCVNSIERKLLPTTRNIKRMKRDNKLGLSEKKDTICWNHNSGAAAINFAIHTGAKRILLLGFDMQPLGGRTHWHEGFQNYTKPTGDVVFERFLKVFPQLAKDAKAKGIEILNVNKDSAIDVFKKVDLKDVL